MILCFSFSNTPDDEKAGPWADRTDEVCESEENTKPVNAGIVIWELFSKREEISAQAVKSFWDIMFVCKKDQKSIFVILSLRSSESGAYTVETWMLF